MMTAQKLRDAALAADVPAFQKAYTQFVMEIGPDGPVCMEDIAHGADLVSSLKKEDLGTAWVYKLISALFYGYIAMLFHGVEGEGEAWTRVKACPHLMELGDLSFIRKLREGEAHRRQALALFEQGEGADEAIRDVILQGGGFVAQWPYPAQLARDVVSYVVETIDDTDIPSRVGLIHAIGAYAAVLSAACRPFDWKEGVDEVPA